VTTLEERFWSKVRKTDAAEGCWEWSASKTKLGYGQFRVGGRKGEMLKAHRVSYDLYCGEIGDLCVLHRCDNRACVRPDHLFLGTQLDNIADREAKGRGGQQLRRGEGNGRAKLTSEQVLHIRDRYAVGGVSMGKMAGEFGVSKALISDILRRKTWVHL